MIYVMTNLESCSTSRWRKIKQLGQQASLLQNGDTDFDTSNPRGCVMSPAYTVQVTQSWL